MNPKILLTINNFLKDRLIEISGILLIIAGIFLIISIVSYSPSDPNFIYQPENVEIKNIGGFYGSVISDFLLQSIGLTAILFSITLCFWGLRLISAKQIKSFISRIFYVTVYIVTGTIFINISFNDSFLLIDNGNSGFVGRIIKENIYNFTTIIENIYSIYFFILLTIIFFILSLNIKVQQTLKIFSKFFLIFKKKEQTNIDEENKDSNIETKNIEQNPIIEKQTTLPFVAQKEVKTININFKLPLVGFLEKNPDLKNKRNINETELNDWPRFQF